MSQLIKDYFTFNRRERKGILFLIGIAVILFFMLNFSSVFYQKHSTDFSEFEKEIAEFQMGIEKEKSFSKNNFSENKKDENKIFISNILPDSAERFEFNPNQLSANEWKRLGLSDKQIRILKNYEANGGKFKKKEDLLKIYGFTEKLFKSLEKYIVIPENHTKNESVRNYETQEPKINEITYKVQIASSSKKIEMRPANFKDLQDVSEYEEKGIFKYFIGNEKNLADAHGFLEIAKTKGYAQAFIVAFNKGKKISIAGAKKFENKKGNNFQHEKFSSGKQNQKIIIEINSSDTTEWEKLRGIGPSYARRIVKYRELLGGFLTVEQLKEVWGMNDTLYNFIFPHLTIDVSKMKKININIATAPDLQKHPYIKNWNIANAIVNYRNAHGNYKTIEEIKKTDLVNDSLYRKIAVYLIVQ